MKYSSRGKKWSTTALMVAAVLVVLVLPGRARAGQPAAPAAPAASATPVRGATPPGAPWIPDDPGAGHAAGGWQSLQWNFADSPVGVQAPLAWANLIRDHRPGASGVTIAVLDTGVAYRSGDGFRRSPDLGGVSFVHPCDLIDGTIVDGRCSDPYPLDRNGHGTFVTSEIAESTNNGYGVTGLAYGARIMPVRVLGANGLGSPATVAEGIRYAVAHGAQVINLSLTFASGLKAAQIPSLISAISDAHAHGVVMVAAAGNDGADTLDFPARDPDVISVGASTADGCLASYSDSGPDLDLVAPGGGEDAGLAEPICHPGRRLPGLTQVGFAARGNPNRFTLVTGWSGTSMAAPEVSAAAAMVIASGVIGRHPSPAAVLRRLERTAVQPVGGAVGGRNDIYGYGIVDIAAATA